MKKCLVMCVVSMSVSLAWAGGFMVAVSEPDGSAPEGTVALVRPLGCHQPSDAVFTATAEGISKGQRRSLALETVRTADGSLAIRPIWPEDGAWVVAVSATYRNQTRSVLLRIDPASGKPMLGAGEARKLSRTPTETDIKAALSSLE